jgi:hypothetical protein
MVENLLLSMEVKGGEEFKFSHMHFKNGGETL